MRDKKYYYCHSASLENYIMENGLQPCRYVGETAVFKKSKQLQDLLDAYWIRHKVFKMI